MSPTSLLAALLAAGSLTGGAVAVAAGWAGDQPSVIPAPTAQPPKAPVIPTPTTQPPVAPTPTAQPPVAPTPTPQPVAPPAEAFSFPATFRTVEVQDLQQKEGRPEWLENERGRLQAGEWSFDGDGKVSFDTINVADDLYPLQGTYTVSGSQVFFELKGEVQAGPGNGTVCDMVGTIELSSGEPVMEVSHGTTGTLSFIGENGPLTQTTTADYTARLTVSAG